jgi:hypothetical protein
MEARIATEDGRNRLIAYIGTVKLPIKVVISEPDRTDEQNKKLHAMLKDLAEQVTHAGAKWDVSIWKRLCVAAWLREEGRNPQMIPAIDGMGIDVLYEQTSKLSMKRCASLITWIEAYGAECGVKWTQKDNWGGRY